MSHEQERMQILEMIESGKVSASEGLHLLASLKNSYSEEPALIDEEALDEEALDQAQDVNAHTAFALPLDSGAKEWTETAAPAGSQNQDSGEKVVEPEVVGEKREHSVPPNMRRWRRWWMLPFWFGVGTTILGGLFMYLALEARGVGFWLVVASIPFVAGVVITALAWQARNARWLHLRVDNIKGSGPKHIAFSFPLPLGAASWALRIFGHKIPHMEGVSVDEILKALDKSASPENPLYIAVDDDEDGERVEIYIG